MSGETTMRAIGADVPLPDLVQKLARARVDLGILTRMLDGATMEFQDQHKHLTERIAAERERVLLLEGAIDAAAVAAYRATGEKHPAPGVAVVVRTTLSYDTLDAIKWCHAAGVPVKPEQLDRRAFEKAARAVPLEFVSYGEEPQATIAKELPEVAEP